MGFLMMYYTCGVDGAYEYLQADTFNRNMKALGDMQIKLDLMRKKLVRSLFKEQDKVRRSFFAQKGGTMGEGERKGLTGLEAESIWGRTLFVRVDTSNSWDKSLNCKECCEKITKKQKYTMLVTVSKERCVLLFARSAM